MTYYLCKNQNNNLIFYWISSSVLFCLLDMSRHIEFSFLSYIHNWFSVALRDGKNGPGPAGTKFYLWPGSGAKRFFSPGSGPNVFPHRDRDQKVFLPGTGTKIFVSSGPGAKLFFSPGPKGFSSPGAKLFSHRDQKVFLPGTGIKSFFSPGIKNDWSRSCLVVLSHMLLIYKVR